MAEGSGVNAVIHLMVFSAMLIKIGKNALSALDGLCGSDGCWVVAKLSVKVPQIDTSGWPPRLVICTFAAVAWELVCVHHQLGNLKVPFAAA